MPPRLSKIHPRFFILCCLLLNLCLDLKAQRPAVILGQVAQEGTRLNCGFQAWDGTWEEQNQKPNDLGFFRLSFWLQGPQLLVLKIAGSSWNLYVEPDDSLFFFLDARQRPRFAGPLARANEVWQVFERDFFPAQNPFELRTYLRVKEAYALSPELDSLMRVLKPQAWWARQESRQQAFEAFMNKETADLSAAFRRFLFQAWHYGRAWEDLAYLRVYGPRHGWPWVEGEKFLGFQGLEQPQLGLPVVRLWAEARALYEGSLSSTENPFLGAFDWAEGLALPLKFYTQAQILLAYLKAKQLAFPQDLWQRFLALNPYPALEAKLRAGLAQREKEQARAGAEIPFRLRDLEGRIWDWDSLRVQRSSLCLQFWASWCGPCLRDLEQGADLRRYWAERGVQFVLISLDREEGPWLRWAGAYAKLCGSLQLWAGPTRELERAYGLWVLPTYVLVRGSEVKWLANPRDLEGELGDFFGP